MITRRHFLQHSSAGFGALAASALLPRWTQAANTSGPLAVKETHFTPSAKRVIFLFMNGGPSHHESFDYKPELANAAAGNSRYLAPAFEFRPHGESGLMISDAFPHLAKHADELCLLNGMNIGTNGHMQGVVRLHTGNDRFVRPSLGSWTVYGLGSEADDLPGFVTISPISNNGGAGNYGAGFLPASFQGTRLGAGSGGISHLSNYRLSDRDQRRQLDFIQQANQRLLEKHPGNQEFEGVIQSYELAFKMQTSVPDTLAISGESEATLDLYGINDAATGRFGSQCLTARRLAEKGVRFIQVTADGWDHHNDIRPAIERSAGATDKPIAGLIADLKQRDMLDDTLILWGGEFGRTAHADNNGGRGHNGSGYTMWMAGGGVKGGYVHGATDELGNEAVDGIMNAHDLHATILHLLGLNHRRLTYRYAGRNFRLTDTEGEVARDILA